MVDITGITPVVATDGRQILKIENAISEIFDTRSSTFLIVAYEMCNPFLSFKHLPLSIQALISVARPSETTIQAGCSRLTRFFSRLSINCSAEQRYSQIQSKVFSTTGNYVLFHFSDFNVGKQCSDTSVTVLDGNGINMEPIEGSSKDAIFSRAKLKQPVCSTD